MKPQGRSDRRLRMVPGAARPSLDQVLDRQRLEPWVSEDLRVAFFGSSAPGVEILLHDVEAARTEGVPLCLDVTLDRKLEDGSSCKRWIDWSESVTPEEVAAIALAFQELVQRMIERGLYDPVETPTPEAAS